MMCKDGHRYIMNKTMPAALTTKTMRSNNTNKTSRVGVFFIYYCLPPCISCTWSGSIWQLQWSRSSWYDTLDVWFPMRFQISVWDVRWRLAVAVHHLHDCQLPSMTHKHKTTDKRHRRTKTAWAMIALSIIMLSSLDVLRVAGCGCVPWLARDAFCSRQSQGKTLYRC